MGILDSSFYIHKGEPKGTKVVIMLRGGKSDAALAYGHRDGLVLVVAFDQEEVDRFLYPMF